MMRIFLSVLLQVGLWPVHVITFFLWCPGPVCGVKPDRTFGQVCAPNHNCPLSDAWCSSGALDEVAQLSRKFAGPGKAWAGKAWADKARTPGVDVDVTVPRAEMDNGGVSRRDNHYPISPAAVPTQQHAAPIDKDMDFSYVTPVQLGTDQQTYYMLSDTGSANIWVMASNCTSAACALHNTFGPANSSSLRPTGRSFSYSYGSGSVSGHLFTDMISIAGFDVNVEIGLADITDGLFASFPLDGIIGLGRPGGKTPPILAELSQSGQYPLLSHSTIFCFYLSRIVDGPNRGELDFGAVNPAKFTGPITYTPLIHPTSDWIITMDSVFFNGSATVGPMPAFIDTGSTFIFGPPDAVYTFHAAVPDAISTDNVTYFIPCKTDYHLALSFSNVLFPVSINDWVYQNGDGTCTSKIFGAEAVADSWLIGTAFLGNVYSIFDTNNARIGFAQKVDLSDSIAANPVVSSTTATQPTSVTIASGSSSSSGSIGGSNHAQSQMSTTVLSSFLPLPTPSFGLVGPDVTNAYPTSVQAAHPTSSSSSSSSSPSPKSLCVDIVGALICAWVTIVITGVPFLV